MKFAEIIRNTGLNPDEFKNSADINITLYDAKERISSEETVHYNEPLFKKNEGSLKNFKDFLTGLEKENIESMKVRIDIDSVILFYKNHRSLIFLRRPSTDPSDFMD